VLGIGGFPIPVSGRTAFTLRFHADTVLPLAFTGAPGASVAISSQDCFGLADATGGRVVYPLENVYKDVDGYLSKPQDAGNFALTVGTGGYSAAIMNGIVDAIGATAGEIQLQYILRYVPSDSDVVKKFRSIEVRVSLPNVKVRARTGYFPLVP